VFYAWAQLECLKHIYFYFLRVFAVIVAGACYLGISDVADVAAVALEISSFFSLLMIWPAIYVILINFVAAALCLCC